MHLDVQSDYKGSKMHHVDNILKLFLQVEGNSDFDYPPHTICILSGLQGIFKSCSFDVFRNTAPRTSPESTLADTFHDLNDFGRFRAPLGMPLGDFLSILFISLFRYDT